MFASTSRTVLGSLSAARNAASFSTSAPRLRSAQPMVVELIEDVPGLGRKYDRVSVKRGRVLSELLPQRLIRLLPWKKAAHRLGVFIQGPERVLPNGSLMIHAPSAKALAVERVMLKLRAMPSTLVFNRRTISAANPAIHGSLTNTDVRERIASVYAVTGGEAEFTWLGNDPKLRIKALGSYKGKIAVRGGDKAKDLVEVEIKVVREE